MSTRIERSPSDDDLRARIDDRLVETIGRVAHPGLREACAYAVLGGGKRVRPILAVRCAIAVGGSIEDALDGGCAVELVHAFSLVHDDLPALDDDDLRRGRPTVHKAYDEATAILAGDALLSVAMETALASPVDPAGIAREVGRATTMMIDGQVWDTAGGFPDDMPPARRLELIHRNKTGALIRCACRVGARAGGADEAALIAIDRWADAGGLMFQVVDDVLDETQSTEHLGKAAGKDREAGKLTYPAVHGLDGARAEVARLRDEALAALRGFDHRADPLRALTEQLATRTS